MLHYFVVTTISFLASYTETVASNTEYITYYKSQFQFTLLATLLNTHLLTKYS